VLWPDDLAQIRSVALRAVSDEDIEHLESIAARGAPFTSCSAAEKAALKVRGRDQRGERIPAEAGVRRASRRVR